MAATCLATALISAHARAASAGIPANLALSSDVLSTSMQQGVSHVLVSLDDAGTIIADSDAAIDGLPLGAGEILQTGIASWYGYAWRGRRTASGQRFNPEAMTAASATLPLGTRVMVTLRGTARSVLVTITDRLGEAGRIIDLSRAAARKIGIIGRGTAPVVVSQGP